ncbi:molybdopterin-dependent oxidoreductase [Paraburkholderia sp. BCC1886]|uniref:molybdopterin-dependent oxidoreductase n=1 Tax=Paraburkholderia sp. BCC1886 TaxID=2562670 RepID=UPI001182CE5E|nr:molybdopterin-dependent oxidoreductase [Paraburkholderia sp. BCC1886]
MNQREIPAYCTLCRSRCGTLNTVRDGQLVSVRPDTAHPTGTAMCMKGRAAPELVHSPHRLRYPMRRTNPKGAADPGWQRISWDEALNEIAARLGAIRVESGAEAVAFAVTTPSGTPLSDSIDWIERFVRYFGSPNICYATEICNWHKDFAHAFTFGCGMPTPDVGHADLIMLWGHNPAAVWLAQANAVGDGRNQGAKLLVVDPRPTALASQADCWLCVRPGTDAALALGLIHLLIRDGRFDEAFVRRWTNGAVLVREDNGHFLRERDLDPAACENRVLGWDEESQTPRALVGGALRGAYDVATAQGPVRCHPAFELLAREAERYTPDHVSTLTSVDPASLLEAARLIGTSPRIAYHAWSGVAQHTNATQTERAIAVLYALTGCFDQTGGNRLYPKHPVNAISELAQLAPEQRQKALGLAERPLGPPAYGWVTARDTYTAILDGEPYKVRALFGFGANPLSSQADTALARRAFEALEFHVHCDLFETPTARYADILLPVGTPWEREGLRVGFELNAASQQRVQLRSRLVEPQGEARSDNQIVFDLAMRLGMQEQFFGGSLEAGWNHMLAPLGVTVEQLRARPAGIDLPLPVREKRYEADGFATETGRVELYSELLLRHGQPALPSFVAPAEERHGGRRFPLLLSSAKNGHFCHSQHRGLVSLRKRSTQPMLDIARALGEARGIEDGDPVIVTTRNGSARFTARLVAALQADTVIGEFGWWQACPEIGAPGFPLEGPGNSHYNGLISSEYADPTSGSVPLRSFRCEIARDPLFQIARRAWSGWRPFVVSETKQLADGVLGIHFTPVDGGGLPDFLPGQHVSIEVETGHGAEPLARAYSLTGSARVENRREYSIAVRHQRGVDAAGVEWQGALSSHLHQRIVVGARVALRAPAGRFTLPLESPQPLVFIAGGIGITPFICQLETLARVGGKLPDITLHYANRNGASHAFSERLQALAAALPGLNIVDYYSEPRAGDACYRMERITDAVVTDTQIKRRARVYMCGPEPMMNAVRAGLVARGMPNFDIFHEAFRSPGTTMPAGERSHAVVFRRSGRTEQWHSSSGTLLEFAEHLGIAMPSGCRVGQCESCAVRVIAGSAMHLHGEAPDDPDVLLGCQAIPTSDLELDA